MLHCLLPNLVPVLVKNKFLVIFRSEPSPLPEFAFELICCPPRVTKGDNTLARTSSVGDVAQNLQARCHGYATVDVDGLRSMIVRAVQHEADLRLDGATREDADASCNPGILFAQRLQEACQ